MQIGEKEVPRYLSFQATHSIHCSSYVFSNKNIYFVLERLMETKASSHMSCDHHRQISTVSYKFVFLSLIYCPFPPDGGGFVLKPNHN